MPELSLLTELREHLVEHELVRRAGEAGAAPECYRHQLHGTPEPAAPDTTVVELISGPVIPGKPDEDRFLEQRIVRIKVRSTDSLAAELLQRRIRNLIAEKRGVFFGQLRIEWCCLFTGDQPTGTDRKYFERTQAFRIAARVKSLAGEPYAP
jgi:hypothetical protein